MTLFINIIRNRYEDSLEVKEEKCEAKRKKKDNN